MSETSRIKSVVGDLAHQIPTVAGAATISIPDTSNVFLLTGSATITKIEATFMPGRRVLFIGKDSPNCTFSGTSISDPGDLDVGAAAVVNLTDECVELIQLNSGGWILVGATEL